MKLSSITFQDVRAAKRSGDPFVLNEVSLSRVYQHTKNGQFGIVTNYRVGRTPEDNRRGFQELRAHLRSLNLGGIVLLGHWQECQDSSIPYEQCQPDLKTDAVEPSLFIPNITLDVLNSIVDKYDQDAAVYAGPETDGKVALIFRGGGTQILGDFQPNRVSRAYSELRGGKGRTFVFEYIAQNQTESLIAEKLG